MEDVLPPKPPVLVILAHPRSMCLPCFSSYAKQGEQPAGPRVAACEAKKEAWATKVPRASGQGFLVLPKGKQLVWSEGPSVILRLQPSPVGCMGSLP